MERTMGVMCVEYKARNGKSERKMKNKKKAHTEPGTTPGLGDNPNLQNDLTPIPT